MQDLRKMDTTKHVPEAASKAGRKDTDIQNT